MTTTLLPLQDIAAEFLTQIEEEFSSSPGSTLLERYAALTRVAEVLAEAMARLNPFFLEWMMVTSSAREEYMPSEPPMSPVTYSFFAYWAFSDLELGFGSQRATLADEVQALLEQAPSHRLRAEVGRMVANLARSRPGVYRVEQGGRKVQLVDLVSGQTFACYSPFQARKGELWLVRLLPGEDEKSPYLVATTPYLLEGPSQEQWRQSLLKEAEVVNDQERFLKYGHVHFSWLEFIFQAYARPLEEAIVLRGSLQVPHSRPHSDGRDLRPAYKHAADGPELTIFPTAGQRKLLASLLSGKEAELALTKSSRHKVCLTLGEALSLRDRLETFVATAQARQIKVAQALLVELEGVIEEAEDEFQEVWADFFETVAAPEERAWISQAPDLLLELTLGSQDKPIMRFVRVAGEQPLSELHQVIQFMFGWEDLHPYQFVGCADETVSIGEFLAEESFRIYRYDRFSVSIDVLRGYETSEGYPRPIAGFGSSPAVKPFAFEEMENHFRQAFLGDLECSSSEFLIKRVESEAIRVGGQPMDTVLVVERPSLMVMAAVPAFQDEPNHKVLEAVEQALSEALVKPRLVVDDRSLEPLLQEYFSCPVEIRRALPEVMEVSFEMQADLAEPDLTYGRLPKTVLRDFLEATRDFYLEAPWRDVGDTEMLLVEGFAERPLIVTILGQAGVEFGLSIVEDPEVALELLEGQPPQHSYHFLTYLEGWSSVHLRQELEELSLPVLPDTVPFVLSQDPVGARRSFQLVTDVIRLLDRYDFDQLGEQAIRLPGSSRAVRVTWPVGADELRSVPKVSSTKLGRNDPCWCGSGKKYKKCHLNRG